MRNRRGTAKFIKRIVPVAIGLAGLALLARSFRHLFSRSEKA